MNDPKKQPSSAKITFRPITEGLGFHPFADGLPYAPVSKSLQGTKPIVGVPNTHSMMGTGAVTAGQPRFVVPVVPHVSVPVSLPRPAQQQLAQPAIPAAVYQAVNQGRIFKAPGWRYVFKRILAYSFDTVLNAGIYLLILSRLSWNGNLNTAVFNELNVLFFALFLFSMIHWGVITFEEILFGITPGKKLFGLRLEGSAISIFLRALFFIPSVAFFGIGLFWALGDRQKGCWHDRLLDIQPIEV